MVSAVDGKHEQDPHRSGSFSEGDRDEPTMSAACGSAHLQVRHHRLRLDRLRRANPPHHVRGRIRKHAREIHAPAHAIERRSDVAVRGRDTGNPVTAAAAVLAQEKAPALGIAAGRHGRPRRFAARSRVRSPGRARRSERGHTHAGTIMAGNASQTIASDRQRGDACRHPLGETRCRTCAHRRDHDPRRSRQCNHRGSRRPPIATTPIPSHWSEAKPRAQANVVNP